MNEWNFARKAHYILDRLVDLYPDRIPNMFEKTFLALTGNKIIYKFIRKIYYHKIKKLFPFKSILIISEVNVGDAINMQESIKVLRFLFPDAKLDFACNSLVEDFIDLPEVSQVHGIIKQNQIPSEADIASLNNLIVKNNYSLVLNFSPNIKVSQLNSNPVIIQFYLAFTSYMLRLRKLQNELMSFSYALHNFLFDMFSDFSSQVNLSSNKSMLPEYKEKSINIAMDSINSVESFLIVNNLFKKKGLLIFHIDTPSTYTQVPVNVQIQILNNILPDDNITSVLLTTGLDTTDFALSIKSMIPKQYQNKISIVPRMEIRQYAALVDSADMVISGDTGIVHIVASKRNAKADNNKNYFRNKTALVTIVGSSDSRIYGYDSENEMYLGTSQDAPSKIFESKAPCRNIACIDKIMKTCRENRCFTDINPTEISDYIINYFAKNINNEPVQKSDIPSEMVTSSYDD